MPESIIIEVCTHQVPRDAEEHIHPLHLSKRGEGFTQMQHLILRHIQVEEKNEYHLNTDDSTGPLGMSSPRDRV